MQTLCALVSHDDAKQRWLQSTGILGLLQRLTVQENPGSKDVSLPPHPVLSNLGEAAPLRLWRESARIIAMISADAASQTMIRSAQLISLSDCILVSPCLLSTAIHFNIQKGSWSLTRSGHCSAAVSVCSQCFASTACASTLFSLGLMHVPLGNSQHRVNTGLWSCLCGVQAYSVGAVAACSCHDR